MAKTPISAHPFRSHARKVLERAGFLIEHTALVAVFLVCIKAIEWLHHAFWATDDPLFFNRLHLQDFFDAMDVGVLLVFTVATLWNAVVVFVLQK